jgi:Protein of unknown function (DUF1273).
MKTCCFTGHRELPKEDSPEYAVLLSALENAVRDAVREGCSRFLVGGAKGFDLLADSLLFLAPLPKFFIGKLLIL